MKIDVRRVIPKGYAVYGYELNKNNYKICKWYLYLFYKLWEKLQWYKICLYRELNYLGIMNTHEGCKMKLSDIWNR